MLMDILGVLIGFITVILLLSMIVTGLVQAIISNFEIRKNNLRRTLAGVLYSYALETESEEHIDQKKVQADADGILKTAAFGGKLDPAFIPRRSSAQVTWIDPETLKDTLIQESSRTTTAKPLLADTESSEDADSQKTDQIEKIVAGFERAEPLMAARFNNIVRGITIVFSLLIAGSFQISTFELLGNLSKDAAMRAQFESMGTHLLDTYDDSPAFRIYTIRDAAADALTDLGSAHEDLAPVLEEASGTVKSVQEAINELALILEANAPEDETPEAREAIIKEYEAAIQNRMTMAQKSGELLANDATNMLTSLNLVIWRDGWNYYFDKQSRWPNWNHLLGVLVTALLLTFGAPFWYEQLRNVARLRDVMKTEKNKN